jgi:hypothetical protein
VDLEATDGASCGQDVAPFENSAPPATEDPLLLAPTPLVPGV